MTMKDMLKDVDTLLALEPEELASFLLADLADSAARNETGDLHLGNYMNRIARQVQGPTRRKTMEVVTEAWHWLTQEGLIGRDPEQGDGWYFITRRGNRLRDRDAFKSYQQAARLPRASLHPIIGDRAWPAFLRGDYDSAVFLSLKQVEIAVRTAGGFDDSLLGVPLMRRAFGPTGPLSDPDALEAEREALASLFAGAIGTFKNPQSHRTVNLTDPSEAAEIVVFASHLMRIVDQRRQALGKLL